METADELAWRIAISSAYQEHVLNRREFQLGRYGTVVPISNREEFQAHILQVLESAETKCFTAFSTVHQIAKADIFYHEPTNTTIIIPENPAIEPTAYRTLSFIGDEHFELMRRQIGEIERRDIPVWRSIYELRPELAAAREAERNREADEKLRKDIDQRFVREKEDMLARHAEELKNAPDKERVRAKQQQELRALTDTKETDFVRYKSERENAKTLLEQHTTRQRGLDDRNPDDPDLEKGRTR